MADKEKQVAVKQPVALIVIDGWGVREEASGNAIMNGDTPVMDALEKEAHFARLNASGLAVGLPDGIMGNSEVGHLTIGAGRQQFQDLIRINGSITDGSIADNAALQGLFSHALTNGSRVHFAGLVSDGAVHAHVDHLLHFLGLAKSAGISDAYVHMYADGRDVPPKSVHKYIAQVQTWMQSNEYGHLVTLVGRYYAMDRDQRWDRVQLAFDAMVKGKGKISADFSATVEERYANGETDEFLKPIISEGADTRVRNGDALMFFDFRADRMREIFEAFYGGSRYEDTPTGLHLVQMTQYKGEFKTPIVFPPEPMDDGLSEWISKKGLQQFHTAETEKYAHVTFFFNGGTEKSFEGEERRLIPSPKEVATYDLKPEMSQMAVADSLIEAISSHKYEFVMCNFAAPDMVGHTGVYEATRVAVGVCDAAIGRVYEACKQHGCALVITSDHGNAEEMLLADGSPKSAHTTFPVPLVVANVAAGDKATLVSGTGELGDVAPTVLHLMGIEPSPKMKGRSLIQFSE